MRWNVLVGAMVGVLLVAIAIAVLIVRAPVDVPAAPGPEAATGALPAASGPTARPSSEAASAPGLPHQLPPGTRLAARAPLPGTAPPPPPMAPAVDPRALPVPPPPPPPTLTGGLGGPPDDLADAGLAFAMDRDGIKAAMRARVPEIKDCYESWLQMAPQTQGTMKVSFRIRPNADGGPGVVDAVHVLDGGLGHLAMEGCVLNVVQDLRFDTPAGSEPVSVTYPFRFATTDHMSRSSPPP